MFTITNKNAFGGYWYRLKDEEFRKSSGRNHVHILVGLTYYRVLLYTTSKLKKRRIYNLSLLKSCNSWALSLEPPWAGEAFGSSFHRGNEENGSRPLRLARVLSCPGILWATFPAPATRGGREASLCVGVSRLTAIQTRVISLTVWCYSVRVRKHFRYVVNIVCLTAGKVLAISVP